MRVLPECYRCTTVVLPGYYHGGKSPPDREKETLALVWVKCLFCLRTGNERWGVAARRAANPACASPSGAVSGVRLLPTAGKDNSALRARNPGCPAGAQKIVAEARSFAGGVCDARLSASGRRDRWPAQTRYPARSARCQWRTWSARPPNGY